MIAIHRLSPRRPLLLVLALVLAATGLQAQPAQVPEMPELVLENLEPGVRRDLAAARDEIRQLTAAGTTSGPELAAAYGELGRRALVYQLHEPAAVAFEGAATLAPDDALWPYATGQARRAAGDVAAARAAFESALARQADHLPSLLALGDMALAGGRLDRARERFAGALEGALVGTDPASREVEAYARYGLGRVAVAAGRPAEAAEQLEAVLRLVPEAGRVRNSLGLAYRDMGEIERAREELAAAQGATGDVPFPDPLAADLGSSARAAYLAAGSAALSAGQAEEAVTRYRQAVELDPDDSVARLELGAALLAAGDAAGAADEARRVLALSATDARAHYLLGRALSGTDPEASIASLERAVELAPDLKEARVALARRLGESGRSQDAVAALQAAVDDDPRDQSPRLALAQLQAELGDLPAAEATLAAVLEIQPANPQAHMDLGALAVRRGAAAAARERFETVLGLRAAPDFTKGLAHFSLGNLDLEAGDPTAAEDHYARAVALAPRLADAHFNLASARAARGDHAAAADAFARAAELAPADTGVRRAWAASLLASGRHGDAVSVLEEGIIANPGRESIDLGLLLAQVLSTAPEADARDGARALEIASRLLRDEPSVAHAEAVAMARAALGEFEEAAQWQAGILQQAQTAGAPAPLVARLEANLERYRAGQLAEAPWTER